MRRTEGSPSIFSRMNRVLEINAEDLDVVVEPGVTREQLNTELRATGLFFPIDPGANASIGGMTATRASGTNAVRYGTMKDNVLSLTVVTANGDEIRTAQRARKSSAGYDLTRLFVGSEGTLGVITSITLRLQGIPEKIGGGVCAFPSVKAACDAVIMTIQMGIPVARIELLDEMQMRACNSYSGLSYAEKPTLFLEFHGTEETVALQSAQFSEIAAEFGGDSFSYTQDAEETQSALEGAAQCLLGVAGTGSASQRPLDGCLRPDIAACRLRRRDPGRYRRTRVPRADRRACRGRQFPCAHPVRRQGPR
jgi:D-lactate dehydrogenase (cytochrome)